MIEYRKATMEDLRRSWDREIQENPGDGRYLRWKEQFMALNASGGAVTFMVLDNDTPVGQGTVLFDPNARAVQGRPCLCDGHRIANINTLRIEKHLEGQGHISQLMRQIEQYAGDLGYTYLTIGVEAAEARNLGIYLHWGYDQLLMWEEQDGVLVLYYGKDI